MKRKMLMVFDERIVDMEGNRTLYSHITNSVVTQLFLRDKNLDISLVLYHNLISKCRTSTNSIESFI